MVKQEFKLHYGIWYKGIIWPNGMEFQINLKKDFFLKLRDKVISKYFIGRVTLLFVNNYLTEYKFTMEFLHNFLKTLS